MKKGRKVVFGILRRVLQAELMRVLSVRDTKLLMEYI